MGSCCGFLYVNRLLNLFCWMVLFCFKTLSWCPKNSEETWVKSIKLNIDWRNSNSFNNTLILDFFWRISSCNKLNWHCWYVLEDFKDILSYYRKIYSTLCLWYICTFQIIGSLKMISKLFKFLSFKITFTVETEQNNKISFSDGNIIHEQGKFITNIYQKRTFNHV